MNFKNSHQKRVEKIKNFANNNKVFTVIFIIVTIFLLFNFIIGNMNKTNTNNLNPNVSQSANLNEVETDNTVSDQPHWRFYWIDLWILVGAGGFCSVMIIRERKKAREKLQ